jgi:hypothetical protein
VVLSRAGEIVEGAPTRCGGVALQWQAELVLLALVRILWELMSVPVGGRPAWEHSVEVLLGSLAIQWHKRAMLSGRGTECRPRVRLCILV